MFFFKTFDFKKAFDKVCHEMLINKLHSHIFKSKDAIRWGSAYYLSERSELAGLCEQTNYLRLLGII